MSICGKVLPADIWAKTANSLLEQTLKNQEKDEVKVILSYVRAFKLLPDKIIKEIDEFLEEMKAVCSVYSQPKCVRSSTKQDLKLPNFQVLSEQLPHYTKARRDFMETFPIWRDIRRENIQSLKTIGRAMHMKRAECNDCRLVGSTLSAIGGAMTLVGAVSAPLTLGLSTPIAFLGTLLIGTGTVGTVAASVNEKDGVKERLQDANRKIQSEKRLYARMVHFFEYHEKIKKAFLDIIDLPSTEGLSYLWEEIRYAARSTEDMIKEIYSYVEKRFSESNCIPLLVAVSFIVHQLRVVNDFVKDISKLSIEVRAITSGVIGGSAGISTLLNKRTATKIAVKKAVFRGILASVSLVMDVVAIAETSEDIDNGSKSKEGLRLEAAAEYLEKELAVFEKVYRIQKGDYEL